MHCRLKCEKPDDIEFTMTITMKASDWSRLRDQLDSGKMSNGYPAWTLVREINDLLGQARKIYWPREPADQSSGATT
jgi:hypothetical protein